MTRVKTRSTPTITVPVTGLRLPAGTPLSTTRDLPGNSEVFAYDLGPKTVKVRLNGITKNIPFFKNCYHRKVERSYKAWSGYKTGNKGLTSYDQWNWIEGNDYATIPSPTAIEPLEDFIDEAFRAMRPRFKGDSNVLNYIYELRELHRFIPNIRSIRKALSGLGSFRNLSDISKVYSEAVLNLNFGIKPLIADTLRLNDDLLFYDQRLKEFCQKAGTLQHRRYIKKYHPSEVLGPTSMYAHGETYSVNVETDLCVRGATMYYYYNIIGLPSRPPQFDTLLRRAGLAAKYHGLRLGALPQAFWNAIPFSFLVDYVLKVSDWLGQLDLGAIDIEVVPLAFCVSDHRRDIFRSNMVGTTNAPGGDSAGTAFDYKVVKDETYRRIRIDDLSILSPSIDPLPAIDSLDDREKMLTINLVNVLRR